MPDRMWGSSTIPCTCQLPTWWNCGHRWRFGKKPEYSRAQNELPPSQFSSQSWCKQPCCLELVPVSGQDRAHRLQLLASLPLSPVTRTSQQQNPSLPIMDFTTWWFLLQTAGHGNNSSRCTDRTNWYIATLQCSTGERPYSNHATYGKAPVFFVDIEFLGCSLAVTTTAAAGDKLTS